MRLKGRHGLETVQGRYAFTAAADVPEKELVLLHGRGGQWRGDLTIGFIEETEFLAFRIGFGSRSTEWAYWHVYFLLWDIEVDRVWVKP